MRNQLTNQRMLTAAKERLAEHLATRPSTALEASKIRQEYLDAASELETDAKSVVCHPRTATEIGRGEHVIDAQHWEAVYHAQSLQESLHLRALAAKERLHAAAWDCDGDDMTAVWNAARDEFQTRVDHYQKLAD